MDFDYRGAGGRAQLRGRLESLRDAFAWVRGSDCYGGCTWKVRRVDSQGSRGALLGQKEQPRLSATVALRLNAAGRRLLERRASVRVHVGYADDYELSDFRMRLVAPGARP